MVDNNSNINNNSNNKIEYPLHAAARNGDHELLSSLLGSSRASKRRTTLINNNNNNNTNNNSNNNSSNLDLPNSKDKDGFTPLHAAAERGHVHCIKVLVKCGASINAKDLLGRRPIHIAAAKGYDKTVKALIRRHAHINKKDTSGKTPLHLAAQHGSQDACKALREAGATKDNVDLDGHTPLHLAALHGHPFTLRSLIDLPVETLVDTMDHTGKTALHLACKNGHAECAKILLDAGAKTTATDKDGCYPLHLASQFTRNAKCVKVLLARGPSQDVASRDSLGRSPLHHAAESGSSKVVKVLLTAGAPASPADHFHKTPLHYSKLHGHVDVSNMLTTRGADITLRYLVGAQTSIREAYQSLHVNQYPQSQSAASSSEIVSPTISVTDISSGVSDSTTITKEIVIVEIPDPFQDADRYGFLADPAAPAKWDEQNKYYLNMDHEKIARERKRMQKWADMLPTFRNSLVAHASSPATQTPSHLVPPMYFAPRKLKKRVYKGIPDSVRGVAWNLLILGHTHHLFQPPNNINNSIISNNLSNNSINGINSTSNNSSSSSNTIMISSNNVSSRNYHNDKDQYSQRYMDLLMTDTEHVRQIDLDVNRTSRNHAVFCERYGLGQRMLFNILRAYAVYDAEVGYTQGMSGLGALLLMYMSEEDAFWCLVTLMQEERFGLRGLFLPGFPRLYRQYAIHEKLFSGLLPDLHRHFDQEGIQTSMYSTRWFLTLFCGVLPFPILLRVWDLILSEGYQFTVHRVAIGLLKTYYSDLIRMPFEEIMTFLVQTEWLKIDTDQFINTVKKIKIPKKLIRAIDYNETL